MTAVQALQACASPGIMTLFAVMGVDWPHGSILSHSHIDLPLYWAMQECIYAFEK